MINIEDIVRCLKKNEESCKNEYSDELIHATAEIVNYVTRQIYEIISARQYSVPNQDSLRGTQRQYTVGFLQANLKDMDLIESGLKKFRLSSDNTYFPTVGQFIALCVEGDLPDIQSAYKEACEKSHFSSDKDWSHDVIRFAAKETGSFVLSNQPRSVSFKLFEHNYEIAKQKFSKNTLNTDFRKAITDNHNYVGPTPVGLSALDEIKKTLRG
jgi:hypothetical protein